jgi:hypothetical protein
MASPGYIAQLLNRLDPDIRTTLTMAFEYVMREYSLGESVKAENFAWFRIEGTTSTSVGTEFSVEHGMDHAPSKLIPILPLDVVNAQLTPLEVSRIADARRIYLKSTVSGATFQAYVE